MLKIYYGRRLWLPKFRNWVFCNLTLTIHFPPEAIPYNLVFDLAWSLFLLVWDQMEHLNDQTPVNKGQPFINDILQVMIEYLRVLIRSLAMKIIIKKRCSTARQMVWNYILMAMIKYHVDPTKISRVDRQRNTSWCSRLR